jgi:hypothetical protein
MDEIDPYITETAMGLASEPLTDYMTDGDAHDAAGNVLAAGAPLVLAEYLDALANRGGPTISTAYLRQLSEAWRRAAGDPAPMPESASWWQVRDGLRDRALDAVDIRKTAEGNVRVTGPCGDFVVLGGEVGGWTWTHYLNKDDDGATDGLEGTGDEARDRMLDAVAYSLKH